MTGALAVHRPTPSSKSASVLLHSDLSLPKRGTIFLESDVHRAEASCGVPGQESLLSFPSTVTTPGYWRDGRPWPGSDSVSSKRFPGTRGGSTRCGSGERPLG